VPIELTVVTPQGEAFSGPVEQVVLPGSEGEFGVLESHERFLTPLNPGVMEIRGAQGSQWAAITDGFAEVDGERVVVMVAAHHRPEEIDRSQAEQSLEQAQQELAELEQTDETAGRRAELESAIAGAQAMIEAHTKQQGSR
jgi:F-type H+-transporting ATPase subunit epsilon